MEGLVLFLSALLVVGVLFLLLAIIACHLLVACSCCIADGSLGIHGDLYCAARYSQAVSVASVPRRASIPTSTEAAKAAIPLSSAASFSHSSLQAATTAPSAAAAAISAVASALTSKSTKVPSSLAASSRSFAAAASAALAAVSSFAAALSASTSKHSKRNVAPASRAASRAASTRRNAEAKLREQQGHEQGSLEQLEALLRKGWGGHASCVLPRGFAMLGSVGEAYEVGSEIGRGGFGCVRRGVERSTGQQVAIKEVDKQAILRRGLRLSDLRMEVRAMLLLRGHPNAVQLLAVHEDACKLSIITEYCSLGDLHDFITSESHRWMDEKQRLTLFKGVVSVLHAAHSKGLLHSDVKPANILVHQQPSSTPGGGPEIVLKVADWGSCVQLVRPGSCTLRPACGTEGFEAPEMQSGRRASWRAGRYGCKVDVYAAGVSLLMFLGDWRSENVLEGSSFGATRLVGGMTADDVRCRLNSAMVLEEMEAIGV